MSRTSSNDSSASSTSKLMQVLECNRQMMSGMTAAMKTSLSNLDMQIYQQVNNLTYTVTALLFHSVISLDAEGQKQTRRN